MAQYNKNNINHIPVRHVIVHFYIHHASIIMKTLAVHVHTISLDHSHHDMLSGTFDILTHIPSLVY